MTYLKVNYKLILTNTYNFTKKAFYTSRYITSLVKITLSQYYYHYYTGNLRVDHEFIFYEYVESMVRVLSNLHIFYAFKW